MISNEIKTRLIMALITHTLDYSNTILLQKWSSPSFPQKSGYYCNCYNSAGDTEHMKETFNKPCNYHFILPLLNFDNILCPRLCICPAQCI